MTQIDVTMIVNGHREGRLAFPTLRSLSIALRRAVDAGLNCEVQAILDRPDEATKALFEDELGRDGVVGMVVPTRCETVDFGDPGLSRDRGVELSRGRFVGWLDADNILDPEWIRRAAEFLKRAERPAIARPACLVFFGRGSGVWYLSSSSKETFRPEVLAVHNLWDSFCMAHRSVLAEQQHLPTNGKDGVGPEDWHWNCEAIARGVPNETVPETAFFYRVKRRGGVNDTHGQSLLPRTALLLDRQLAALALSRRVYAQECIVRDGRVTARPQTPARAMLARMLAGEQERGAALMELDQRPPDWVRGRSEAGKFDPVHYRALYADLAKLSDDQCVRHFQENGRGEGRIGWLSPPQVEALRAVRFQPDDYRLRYADVSGFSIEGATRHFIEHGLAEDRIGVMSAHDRSALHPDGFDPEDYAIMHGDISGYTEFEAISHWLKHGVAERRIGKFSTAVERMLHPRVPPSWLMHAVRRAHEVEPIIGIPQPEQLLGLHPGPDRALALPPEVTSYWSLVDALPSKIDYLFVAPWVTMGGGDLVLLQYLAAVRELDPTASVALITTEQVRSSRLDQVPEGVRVAEFKTLVDPNLSAEWRAFILGTLIMQHAPHTLHTLNSNVCFDAIDRYGKALTTQSKIFISTWVVERTPHDEMASWMFHRSPEFMDHISAVLTDHAALGGWYEDLYRVDRGKFVVHRQAVAEAFRPRQQLPVDDRGTVKLLWAGRFTRQKRLDVLAAIVERLRDELPQVEVHFYGDGHRVGKELHLDEHAEAALERLEDAGAIRHPPYRDGFSSLPLQEYAMFVMTSETEGTPNVLLEALAVGLPTVAPLVGGIPEILDADVGFPITACDAIEEYVAAIRYALTNYDEALTRARRARALIDREFTAARFRSGLSATPGYLRANAAA